MTIVIQWASDVGWLWMRST